MGFDPANFARGMVPDKPSHRAADLGAGLVLAPRFSGGEVEPTATVEEVLARWSGFPCRDQGQTNTCTRYSAADAIAMACHVEHGSRLIALSPLYLRWHDDPDYRGGDRGQAIFITAETAQERGVCTNLAHPDRVLGQSVGARLKLPPDRFAEDEAPQHQVRNSFRIPDAVGEHILGFLADVLGRGLFVQFGLYLRNGFYAKTGADGIVTNDGDGVGWHAMVVVAIVRVAGVLYAMVRNSYGTSFGRDGYVLIPLSEMQKARDLRVFTSVELPVRVPA